PARLAAHLGASEGPDRPLELAPGAPVERHALRGRTVLRSHSLRGSDREGPGPVLLHGSVRFRPRWRQFWSGGSRSVTPAPPTMGPWVRWSDGGATHAFGVLRALGRRVPRRPRACEQSLRRRSVAAAVTVQIALAAQALLGEAFALGARGT